MNDVIQKTFENSITLVRVSDGESASSYSIDTNYNEILKFVRSIGDGGEELDFSPPSLEFKVFNFLDGKHLADFHWNLSYLNGSEFVTIAEREENNYPEYFVYETLDGTATTSDEETNSSSGINEALLTFRVAAFYEAYKNTVNEKERLFIQAMSDNAPLKFVYFDNTDNRILATKIITIQNGVSADMAKLNIGATGIVASIRDAALRFDANGLTVQNGSFVIEREYIRAVPQPDSETFTQADYYYKESSGVKDSYVKASGDYDPTQIYYIKADEINKKVLYADDDGNLTIVGNVHANNGYFKGEVHATSGTFEGTISSKEGQIGGFEISEDSITSINGTIQLKSRINTDTSQDESEILAGKITIKEGYLTDKIVIQANASDEHGRVVLSNPTINNGKVLESGTLVLKSNGYLQLGNIEMYGGGQKTLDGYIRSTFTDEAGLKQNGFWQINENGTAHFDQIYANNARIKNSVLEINTVQTVGSLMLFKDSWPVIKIETYQAKQEEYPGSTLAQQSSFTASAIYVEGRASFAQGDYLYANGHYYLVDSTAVIQYYELIEEVKIVEGKEQTNSTYTPTSDRVFQSNKKYFMKDGQNYVPVEYSNFVTFIELRSLIDENDTIVTKIGKIKNMEIALFAEAFETGMQYYRFNKINAESQNIGSFYEQFSSGIVNSYDNSFIEGKDYYWKEKLEINTADEFQVHYNNGNIYTVSIVSEGGQMLSILGESRKESGTGIQDFAVGNSLTISEISDLGGKLGFVKHLILGDLTETGIDILTGMGGWGLYCDNVYLNGALATKDIETYAGINTKSGVQFNQDKEGQEQQDRSNIVFWGGANGTDEASIQSAKFQVTAAGTLYAQDAIIKNSIFSGADIYSARLFTAEIHGSNGQLTIYDSSSGIAFKKEDGTTTGAEIYTLKNNGFFRGQNAFVTIPTVANGMVQFNGNFLSNNNSKQVGLNNGIIAFSHGMGEGKIEFQVLEENTNNSVMQFTINEGIDELPQIEIKTEKTIIRSEAGFENNIWFTDKMQYQKVDYGYDLYVYE